MPGVIGSSGPKDLGVNSAGVGAPLSQVCGKVAEECGRSTKVEISVSGQSETIEQGCIEVANGVVIPSELVLRLGLAVDNMALTAHERLQQFARFLCEGVLGPVPGTVEPPDLATGSDRRKRVQHREYGGSADAGAHQYDWRIAGPQRKSSSRRTHFQNIARMHLIVLE